MDNTLDFYIDVYDNRGNMLDRLAALHNYDDAEAVFERCAKRYPEERIVWRQKARTIKESKE